MKKLIFIATIILLAAACGPRQPAEQEAEQLPEEVAEQPPEPAILQAGNLLGHHTINYELAPGVTLDEYLEFLKDEYAPAWEKHFPGVKGFILEGRTGECAGCTGFLFFIESDEVRDKYWRADGSLTEEGEAASEKMQPVVEKRDKLAEHSTSYTDWEITGDSGIPGPELQAGNLLGLHTMHYELAPGVTTDEFLDFIRDESIPAWDNHFPGLRTYLLHGRTGECAGCYGFLIFLESDEVRDKYWQADGSYTELGEAAYEKIQPVSEKGSKLFDYTTTYTDWVIQ